MSAMKIVKASDGRIVGFGPNADFYDPAIPAGGALEYGDSAELYVPEPTPLEQIRALEAPYDDDFKKIQRQFLIASLFKEAKAHPAAAGMSDAQIHAYLLTQGKGYAKLYELEQSIVPLRELIP